MSCFKKDKFRPFKFVQLVEGTYLEHLNLSHTQIRQIQSIYRISHIASIVVSWKERSSSDMLDLFFKFIKISKLICELKISFKLLYNSALGIVVLGINAASQQTLLLSPAPHPIQCYGEVTSMLYWGSQQSWGSMVQTKICSTGDLQSFLLQNILLLWLSLIY